MADALSLLQKAEGFYARGRYDRARPLFARAREKTTDPYLRADILHQEAETLRALGLFHRALALYGRAHALYRRLKVPTERLRTLLGVSACLRVLGRYARARALWRTVERAGRFGASSPPPEEIWMESALVERGLGNFPRARSLLQRALRAPGISPAARQHAWWSLGGVERFSGRLPSAVDAFSRAAALARRLGDPSAEAFALCGAGGVARVLGRSAASLAFYRRAHGLLDRLGDPFGRAYGLCGMANAHRTYGDARKTLPLYHRSAGLYRRLGDESSEGFAWWGLGGSYRRLGRWAESRRAYGKALGLFRKSDDARGVVMAVLGLGAWAEETDRAIRAVNFRERALREARRHRLSYETALARWALDPRQVGGLGAFGVSPATVKRWKDIP